MDLTCKIEGGDFTHAGQASSHLKKILKSLSLDSTLIRRTVVALYEAGVNVAAHAWSGVISVNILPDEIDISICDRENTDFMEIHSKPGEGTELHIINRYRQ